MRQRILCAIFVTVIVTSAPVQSSSPAANKSPGEIVDRLWRMATQGKLLTANGWQRAAGFFSLPATPPDNSKIWVTSNDWGLDSESIKGSSAEVVMGFEDEGTIDAALRYTPPPKTDAVKTGIVYHLILQSTHAPVYGPDGKTVVREMTGPAAWQIEDSPKTTWTTVNTAIRYVLETRSKTSDPILTRNADDTIAKLLRLD